jgi:hypothetical protein
MNWIRPRLESPVMTLSDTACRTRSAGAAASMNRGVP